MNKNNRIKYIFKPMVFSLALLPFGLLGIGVFDAMTGSGGFSTQGFFSTDLGADPQKFIVHKTGAWALKFLLITLSITPLRRWMNWNQMVKFRRMMGLFCFFYASLHFLSYYLLYLEGDWSNVATDIIKRPYITVGFSAWLTLIPLALTSTQSMMKKLGRKWLKLHQSIYFIGVAAVTHFWWQVKSDVNEPVFYTLILSILLGSRLWFKWKH